MLVIYHLECCVLLVFSKYKHVPFARVTFHINDLNCRTIAKLE